MSAHVATQTSVRPPDRRSLGKLPQGEFDSLKSQILLEYPLPDFLANYCGVKLKMRGKWLQGNCPFPNHSDDSPSFKVNAYRSRSFHCFGCAAHGDIFTLAKELHGMQTWSEQVMFITGRSWSAWINGLPANEADRQRVAEQVEALRREQEAKAREREEKWRAAPDHVAGPVYEAFLQRLTLDPPEQAEMKRRGMDPDIAYELGYRTLPSSRETRIAICAELRTAGLKLSRVPGFFLLPAAAGELAAGRWCFAGSQQGTREYEEQSSGRTWKVRGLLCPVVDDRGRVVQLKIRNGSKPDDLPEWVEQAWPAAKYMVVGSEGRREGATPLLKVHHAGPRDGGDFPGVLWVTEGEIKTDIGALYLNARFLGLPGASQNPQLAIDAAVFGNYQEVRVCFDQDNKDHVRWATTRLCRALQTLGLTATVVVWDGDLAWEGGHTKGIDDLLAAGGSYEVLSYEDWWETLAEESQLYIEKRLEGACTG